MNDIMRYGSIYNILYTIMGVNYIGFLNHNNVSCTVPIHQASVKFHERATSSTSPSAPSVLPFPSPHTTASHMAHAAPRSALLRNYTTVLNHDNCVRKHMTARTTSRNVTLALCPWKLRRRWWRERGEEGGFERGAEERWERCGVDRLEIRWWMAGRKRLEKEKDARGGNAYV